VKGLSKPLLLVGVHFVAFPLTADRCAQREAQASVVRDLLVTEGLMKNYHVIVAGDFNDHDPTIVDEAGSVPISKVFNIIKGAELDNAMSKHPGYNTGVGVFSGWWDKNSNCRDDKGGEHTLIDHVLVSKSLPLRSIRFIHTFTAACTSIISDHWPIIIDITTVAAAATEEEQTEGVSQVSQIESVPEETVGTAAAKAEGEGGIGGQIMWVGVGAIGAIAVVAIAVVVVVMIRKRRSGQEESYLLV